MHKMAKEVNGNETKEKIPEESLEDNLSMSSSSDSSSGTKSLSSTLTSAGAFSFANIVSLALHELFDNQWDRNFSSQCLSDFIEHLNLPKTVFTSLSEFSKLYNTDGAVDVNEIVKANLIILRTEPAVHEKFGRLIEHLLYFALKEGKYDARMRVLIHHLSSMLNIPTEVVEFYEESVIKFLCGYTAEVTEEEYQKNKKRERSRKMKRYALIGLATLGGGAALGLTGGLVAPLIGAGVSTFLGAGSVAMLGSFTGAAVVGSLFGVAGAGLTGFKVQKVVGEVKEFEFEVLNGDQFVHKELHLTIAVSGWLSDEKPDNFIRPWRTLMDSKEQYILRYESEHLLKLGRAMDYVLSFAVSTAAQEALKYTLLNGIVTAVAWPATLLTLLGMIDNPWNVCCRRSEEVGKMLAEALLLREQGQRPVTLLGYSLGARVIYYCLKEMSGRKECEGIVENAVLLGAPVTAKAEEWAKLTRVVAGRLVNGYSRRDWLLKYLYRIFSMAGGTAGLQPIKCSDRRIENVDLTEVISGHGDYSSKISSALEKVKIRTKGEVPTDLESVMKKSASDIPRGSENQETLADLKKSRSVESLLVKH